MCASFLCVHECVCLCVGARAGIHRRTTRLHRVRPLMSRTETCTPTARSHVYAKHNVCVCAYALPKVANKCSPFFVRTIELATVRSDTQQQCDATSVQGFARHPKNLDHSIIYVRLCTGGKKQKQKPKAQAQWVSCRCNWRRQPNERPSKRAQQTFPFKPISNDNRPLQ